jgi:hypothetical protein
MICQASWIKSGMRLMDMKAAPKITPPAHVVDDLCTVWPLMDVHFGMLAWGRETGGPDYDTKVAADDMRHAFAKVSAITPDSAEGVLIIGGDFFHADDNRSETPATGTSWTWTAATGACWILAWR